MFRGAEVSLLLIEGFAVRTISGEGTILFDAMPPSDFLRVLLLVFFNAGRGMAGGSVLCTSPSASSSSKATSADAVPVLCSIQPAS